MFWIEEQKVLIGQMRLKRLVIIFVHPEKMSGICECMQKKFSRNMAEEVS
jgi:hypothetical protein